VVFLDRDNLPAGESYDQHIERAINDSDVFLFLISTDSLEAGRYTLTELTLARRKWPNPNGRVLPVMVRKTSLDQVPSYLKAVTILEPVGNITAETAAAVDRLRRAPKRNSPEFIASNNNSLASAIGLLLSTLIVDTSRSLIGSAIGLVLGTWYYFRYLIFLIMIFSLIPVMWFFMAISFISPGKFDFSVVMDHWFNLVIFVWICGSIAYNSMIFVEAEKEANQLRNIVFGVPPSIIFGMFLCLVFGSKQVGSFTTNILMGGTGGLLIGLAVVFLIDDINEVGVAVRSEDILGSHEIKELDNNYSKWQTYGGIILAIATFISIALRGMEFDFVGYFGIFIGFIMFVTNSVLRFELGSTRRNRESYDKIDVLVNESRWIGIKSQVIKQMRFGRKKLKAFTARYSPLIKVSQDEAGIESRDKLTMAAKKGDSILLNRTDSGRWFVIPADQLVDPESLIPVDDEFAKQCLSDDPNEYKKFFDIG
jgi:TIR domain